MAVSPAQRPDSRPELRPDFRPGMPAARAHARLTAAVAQMQRAEKCAVLWFAEIEHRHLYLDLGYASMSQYATEALGFSRARIMRTVSSTRTKRYR